MPLVNDTRAFDKFEFTFKLAVVASDFIDNVALLSRDFSVADR